MKVTSLDKALGFIENGWSPVPVEHRTKKCVLESWPELRIDAATAPQYFNGKAQNIGVLTGTPSGGLLDVDLDNPLARALALQFLPVTEASFGRHGNPNSHHLYQALEPKTPDTVAFADPSPAVGEKAMLVELRASGSQTVFPGSVHESGEAIEWVQSGQPARIDYVELKQRVSALAAAVLIAKRWTEGVHNRLNIVLIGYLQRRGWEEDKIERFISIIANAVGDDKVEERVARVGKLKKVPGRAALAKILGKEVLERFEEWMGFQHVGVERDARIVVHPGGLPEAVDAAFDLLVERAAEHDLYVSAGALVRPYLVRREGFAGGDGTPEVVQSLELCRMSLANFNVELGRLAAFATERTVKGGGVQEVLIDCPPKVAQAVFEATDRLHKMPQIERLAEVPVFDGRVLHAAPGLHGTTWVNAPVGIALRAELSQEVASAALSRVMAYLDEFPFEDDTSRAVGVALLLTAALRPSLGTAPGFLITKPSYGAGATYLAKAAGVVLSGRTPPVMPFSRKEEAAKQLNAALVAGTTILIADNLPEGVPLSDPLLAQLLSEPEMQVRELGTGRTPVVDCRRLVIATGVGVTPADDLVRRLLTVRLDPKVERADARAFRRPDLLQELQAARASVLSDLYTITASYLAQNERVAVKALVGYAQWLRWVAEPLHWLGLADVVDSAREAASNDATTGRLMQLIPLVEQLQARPEHRRFDGVSVNDMLMSGRDEFDDDGAGGDRKDGGAWRKLKRELHDVLGEATGAKIFDSRPQLNPLHVAHWLRRVKQRVVGDKRLVEAARRRGQPLWKVETLLTTGGGS